MSKIVELKGTREFMDALKRAGERAERELMNALLLEAEGIMEASVKLVPVDEGVLRASRFVRMPRKISTGVMVEFGYGGAATSYALYLHEGTGPAVGRPPFMPPVSAFKGWAARVLGDEKLAYVVARAVGRRGLKPLKFLERPLRVQAKGMDERIARRVRAVLRRQR